MRAFLLECGGNPGRGGHSVAIEAGRVALRCRRAVQEILGLPGDPGRIAFFQNATQALNTALWGTLRRGDAVVVTAYDHNAVLRPVDYLARERGVEVRMAGGDREGGIDLDEVSSLLRGARLLVVNSASNVLGTRLPLRALAERAHEAGARVLLDAAQCAGHVPMDAAADGADLVAFTGHKGLLGPPGVGGLWVREGVEVEPLLRGGTGGNSLAREMPPTMPDRLEAGTGNVAGMAGLEAGIRHLLDVGVERIHRRSAALKERLREGLAAVPGLEILTPPAPDGVGIVCVRAATVDPSSLAERLDREWNVQARPGLHCAPEVHGLLGTTESGALRFSLGWASTGSDVDAAVQGCRRILAGRESGTAPAGTGTGSR